VAARIRAAPIVASIRRGENIENDECSVKFQN
jgi:hypothetical protein